jgi:hypothetical protein
VELRDASEIVELREYFADKIYAGAGQRRRMCLTRRTATGDQSLSRPPDLLSSQADRLPTIVASS